MHRRVWVVLRAVGAGLVAAYCVGRAVAEAWTIDPFRSETYRQDWGGPHLLGVLLVHCGPGVLVIVALCIRLRRRWRPLRQG